MLGKYDADRKVVAPEFFLKSDGTGNPAVPLGVAAYVRLNIRDRIVHVYRSAAYNADGVTPAPADYHIKLPPVAECAGLTFAFTVVENLVLAGTSYYATIHDLDDSFHWTDIDLKAVGESIVLYSDGLKWHRIQENLVGLYELEETTGAQAITATTKLLDLSNDAGGEAIAATIADANTHAGLFVVRCIKEPASSHTLTLTGGHFDGAVLAHAIATFSDIDDVLVVYFDPEGEGQVIAQIGSVVLT